VTTSTHLIDYARVSTSGQDTATQVEKLKAAGCTIVRTEKVSGGSREGRSELASIMDAKGQARTLACYTCARSTAFALIGVYTFVSGSVQWLQAATTGMIIVQALDAAIAVTIKDAMKTFGPAGTAIEVAPV
jgi:Resolvase, N terminal domain